METLRANLSMLMSSATNDQKNLYKEVQLHAALKSHQHFFPGYLVSQQFFWSPIIKLVIEMSPTIIKALKRKKEDSLYN